MTKTDLQKAYEDAEAQAQKIMADRDEALAKVRDRYDDRLRKATDKVAQAQKALLNQQVLESLKDRADRWAVLDSLTRQGWNGGPTQDEITAVLGDKP